MKPAPAHGQQTSESLARKPCKRQSGIVIVSFGHKATADVFHGIGSRDARRLPAEVVRVAVRKLDMLSAAHSFLDLRSPPGNRLEALRGGLAGLPGIRINDQWRLVFRWRGTDAEDVRIIDYHRG